jgi:hypothetical protein
VNFIDILKGKKVASSQELGHIIVELGKSKKYYKHSLIHWKRILSSWVSWL